MTESLVASGPNVKSVRGVVRYLLGAPVRLLASLKLTVALVVFLSAAVAGGLWLEAAKGRECAFWYVYGSQWFLGLLGMLTVNVAAATLVRRPWRWSRPGFVIAPIGVVILLAGFIETSLQGLEGRLILWPGEVSKTLNLTHRSQITLLARHGADVQSTELCFSPGPADWRSDQPLDFGDMNGTSVRGAAILSPRPLPDRICRRRSRAGKAGNPGCCI